MKKLKSIILIIIVSTSILLMNSNHTDIVYAKTAIEFSDLNYSDWFIQSVSYLVNKEAINGYVDNTFRPNNDITREEFVKVLILSLYSEEDITLDDEEALDKLDYSIDYWATPYLKKAEATGIIDEYIVNNYNYSADGLKKSITRGEIAYLIMNVEDEVKNTYLDTEQEFTFDDAYYMYMIEDIKNDDYPIAQAEVDCFKYGIISGYPDGTYKSANNASRADAATMIVRFLLSSSRLTLEIGEDLPFSTDNKGIPTFRDSSFQRPVHYAYDDPYVIYKIDRMGYKLEMIEQIGVSEYEGDPSYIKLFTLRFYGNTISDLDEYELFLYTGHIRLILAYGSEDVDEILEFVDTTELYLYDYIKDPVVFNLDVLGKDGKIYKIECEVGNNEISYRVYGQQ